LRERARRRCQRDRQQRSKEPFRTHREVDMTKSESDARRSD
jgi:hypothetical protein